MSGITWHINLNTVVVALMLGNSNARGPQISGPKDIKREAGWTGIQINCPFPVPIWRINSTLYEPLSLKPPLSLNSFGINIAILLESYNNTEFQCYSPDGPMMYVQESTIGHLTVLKSSKSVDQCGSIDHLTVQSHNIIV